MAILSIIDQPLPAALHAAYRPIVFLVKATRTDGMPIPPVVFCDVYVKGVFYKSIEKTQYYSANDSYSEWQFDIQDACQEVLKSLIPTNGLSEIVPDTSAVSMVYCKFRSSGYNSNGFFVPEGTEPVQGTGTKSPINGSGTQSNSFYVVNAVLQHDQNQQLASHLNYFKKGSWEEKAYPLSHRNDNYKICTNQSDFFPIINLSDKEVKCIVINYKSKYNGQSYTAKYCPSEPCVSISIEDFTFENAVKDVPYLKTVQVFGTGPFQIEDNLDVPAWMSVNLSGNKLTFSGTPTVDDVGPSSVDLTLSNACGYVDISKIIQITAEGCAAVSIPGSPVLINGNTGRPYNFEIPFIGDPPFSLSGITKPIWMNIAIVGSAIVLSGTPTEDGTDIPVSFTINNCITNTVSFSGTFNVTTISENITGTISKSNRSISVSLSSPLLCDCTFYLYGIYDDFGDEKEFSANLTISAGQTSASLLNAAPRQILCIKPTVAGTNKFTQILNCAGTEYHFSLDITNPC